MYQPHHVNIEFSIIHSSLIPELCSYFEKLYTADYTWTIYKRELCSVCGIDGQSSLSRADMVKEDG